MAISPTKLVGKWLCAIALFCIPSDPEVFGLPLYTFWWASILLFLVVLWDEKSERTDWRLFVVVVGGLSSPVIVMTLPVLYFRIFLIKDRKRELLVAFVATMIATCQLYYILSGSATSIPHLSSIVSNVTPTFFGSAIYISDEANRYYRVAGDYILFIFLAVIAIIDRRNIQIWGLIYLLAGSIALSVSRVDPTIIHPVLAGPRYFFYPFIIISWMLIQTTFNNRSWWIRSFSITFLIGMAYNAIPAWSRGHDDLNWKSHIASCPHFESYKIPIQFDGNKASAWSLSLDKHSCHRALSNDWFFPDQSDSGIRTFPYKVVSVNNDKISCPDNPIKFINASSR